MSRAEAGPFDPLRRDDGAAAFDEPWQAQVLALADTLSSKGVFTPSAWSAALGAALRRAEAAGAPDTPETYYRAAVEALEGLLTDAGVLSEAALDARKSDWHRAYLETPHGKPVELRRD